MSGDLAIENFRFHWLHELVEYSLLPEEILERVKRLEGREPGEVEGRWLLENEHLIPAEYRNNMLLITGWWRPITVNPPFIAYLYGKDGRMVLDWHCYYYSLWRWTRIVRIVDK